VIFDKFAGFVEENRNLFRSRNGDLFERIESAALFHFPIKPDAVLSKEPWGKETWNDFHLPFNSVCVEDNASAVFLFDLVEGQLGFGRPRIFIDIFSNQAGIENFRTDTAETAGEFWNQKETLYLATFGRIDAILPDLTNPARFHSQGSVDLIVVFDDHRKIKGHWDPETCKADQEMVLNALANPNTALEELSLLMRDTHNFILETAPTRPRQVKDGRIRRSHDRPIYTLLNPGAIRQRIGVAHEPATTQTRTPHERRAHFRTFRDERYTKVRGQRKLIPATWIGPNEVVKRNKRYRVLLDR